MKNKQINKYFNDNTYHSSSSIYFESFYNIYKINRKENLTECFIKTSLDYKLPLQILTIITRLAEQDESLWDEDIELTICKGRGPELNYCSFKILNFDLATEVCRILDIIGTGLVQFDLDKFNFPMQYKGTDKTIYYDMYEEKYSVHPLDKKEFNAKLGIYKFLRVVDAIMSSTYTSEREATQFSEDLYAKHEIQLKLLSPSHETYYQPSCETKFYVKSDALKDRIISILEK